MTKTEICNLALARLGITPIDSIDDTTSNVAKLCKSLFTFVLSRLLSQYSWGFAEVVANLNLLALEDDVYDYVYAYPASALRLSAVLDYTATQVPEYALKNIDDLYCIVTNEENAKGRYVVLPTNLNVLPSLFVNTLKFALALDLHTGLKKEEDSVPLLMQEYRTALQLAVAAHAREKSNTTGTTSCRYIDAR